MDNSSPPRISCVSSLRAGRCVRCASQVWSLRPSPRCPALTPPLWTALSFRPSLRSLFVSLPPSHCLCVTPSSRVSLPLSPLSLPPRVSFGPLSGGFSLPCVCVCPCPDRFPLGPFTQRPVLQGPAPPPVGRAWMGTSSGNLPEEYLRLSDVQRCPVVAPQPTALCLLPA